MTKIHCSVENCKYNELRQCVADKIDVGKQGLSEAQCAKETECSSFICGR